MQGIFPSTLQIDREQIGTNFYKTRFSTTSYSLSCRLPVAFDCNVQCWRSPNRIRHLTSAETYGRGKETRQHAGCQEVSRCHTKSESWGVYITHACTKCKYGCLLWLWKPEEMWPEVQNRDVSRKPQYKDIYRRTIEIPQRSRTFQANCCLKVHNAHLKLLSPISG